MAEQDIIQRYFTPAARRQELAVGNGDDAAVFSVPSGHQLVTSTDTLNIGVHFPESTSPEAIGHKSLAVNLSDLAAMGASPAFVTLALSLPRIDEHWLERFSTGFLNLARIHQVDLVGGDLVRGPLSITVNAMGYVPEGRALRRDGAKPGDLIFVTGTVGDAALGLSCVQGRVSMGDAARQRCCERLNRPVPRIEAGIALRSIATAAIDVSDGVSLDLTRVLDASGVGAELRLENMPVSKDFLEVYQPPIPWHEALAGGDDYELLFTAPESAQADVRAALKQICAVSTIGSAVARKGLKLFHEGRPITLDRRGFDHF